MVIPRSFEFAGETFFRVTIKFAGGRRAKQARAWVHDALSRAHGFRTTRRMTDRLALRGGRFRVAIARRAVRALVDRLRLLVEAGLIRLHVAGRRVRPA